MNTLLEKWVNSSDLYWTNALDTDIRCHNESHCLFNIDVDDAHWVYVTDIFVVKIKEKKKTSTTKLSWTIYNGFRHSKDYKKFESFCHLTEVNSLTFFCYFSALSRKRYVKEKLFNQMLTEFSARQCEKSNDIDLNTEYSEQFGSSNSKETDQQVHF